MTYEARSGHRQVTHKPGESCPNNDGRSCVVCELFICSICGAAEGALLPMCPGRRLTEAEHDENYKHYCNNTGPFTEGS